MSRTTFALVAALVLTPYLASAAPFTRGVLGGRSSPLPMAATFMWGAANSSFQVEGSPVDSDWLRWTKTPGKIKDGTTADVASDFWNRYEEDFRLAQAAGLNTFRISVAWERIQPAPDKWNDEALAHYEKILVAMRSHGLEPMVTL